jgi:hypothetical protein
MNGTSKDRKAAIGFRTHSGWACAILAAGSRRNIEVVERRRIELCDPEIPGSKQPFHHAEHMNLANAERFIAQCAAATARLGRQAIGSLQEFAAERELDISRICVIAGTGRALPDLRGILASHAQIHAAEGEFYRDALLRAAKLADLATDRLKEKEAVMWTAARLGSDEHALAAKLITIGKTLGPPWGADQKLATLAAWSALAS